MPVPCLLLLSSLAAHAAGDLPPADRWLATDMVAVGVAADGSLGNPDAGLGLVFDPDGAEGPFPPGGDVLLPGRAFETWALQAGADAWVQAAPDSGSDLELRWDPPVDDGRLAWLHGSVDADMLLVDAWVVLPWGQPVAWLLLDLEPTVDLDGAWLARSFDPDIDSPLDGSSRTSNAVQDGVVVASGAVDGRAWALAAVGGQGGICSWCSLPSDIVAGTSSSEGDQQLGLAVDLGDVLAGEGVRVLFAYGFGVDSGAAVAAAQDAAASVDLDGDGADWTDDCDDLDATVSPLAEELPGTGVDEDCDGVVDEDEPADTGVSGRDDWDQEIPAGDTGQDLAPATRQTGGCTTSTTGRGGWGWLLATALLLLRRRR
ncbi:MAG: hypothetical protein D6798_19795 [Deltaproteobacteria bacterium]|nr:MAG: hypothetical protein D6798_19795 [Deltaproteobacteria bacterium]